MRFFHRKNAISCGLQRGVTLRLVGCSPAGFPMKMPSPARPVAAAKIEITTGSVAALGKAPPLFRLLGGQARRNWMSNKKKHIPIAAACFHGYNRLMLVIEPITHIRLDERGVAWIGDTNVKVVEVAMDQTAYDWDAEEIHAAHPHLSQAHIHAALSYYHAHKSEMDGQRQGQLENYLRLRNKAAGQLTKAALQERLLA